VPAVHNYKAIENATVQQIAKALARVWERVATATRQVIRAGNQKFTVMFIPHSEQKIFNFQISVFALLFIATLVAVLIFGFLTLSTHFSSTNERYGEVSASLRASELALESLNDEIKDLERVVTDFKTGLESVLNVVGPEAAGDFASVGGSGDLASFVSETSVASNDMSGVTDLRGLGSYLESAIAPLTEINDALLTQRELLVDIPTLWPVKGGRGWITTEFGPARHPFTNGFYLHKGIDIALRYGVEILATANGTIQRVDYDAQNLGNYAVIKHNYGFSTRYGHMQRVVVENGQAVVRGQVIGYMGSTGLSTGPHVHYEVRIAEQVVNPRKFLAFASKFEGSTQ